METIHEIIPFAKEMLSQKPTRGMVKLYLVGSVLAVLGTVLGLVDTVCQPFSSHQSMDAELALLMAREQRALEAEERRREGEEEKEGVKAATEEVIIPKTEQRATGAQRNASNRLHAS